MNNLYIYHKDWEGICILENTKIFRKDYYILAKNYIQDIFKNKLCPDLFEIIYKYLY